MEYVNGPLEHSTATHTYCYILWPYACMIKVPEDLLLFNLVNCKTYKLVCVPTTIIHLDKFHVDEIDILFVIMCGSEL